MYRIRIFEERWGFPPCVAEHVPGTQGVPLLFPFPLRPATTQCQHKCRVGGLALCWNRADSTQRLNSQLAPVSPPASDSRSCSSASITKTITQTSGRRTRQGNTPHRHIVAATNRQTGAAVPDSLIACPLRCGSLRGEASSIFKHFDIWGV